MSTDLAPAIAELPEVDGAVGVAFGAASITGSDVEPTIVDPEAMDATFDLGVVSGSLADLQAGELALSTRDAATYGVGVGDTVTMSFVDGTSSDLAVGAIFEDRMNFGDVLITREDWAPHARQTGDTVVFVTLADGVDEAAGQDAVRAVTERFDAPEPQTRDEYRDSVGRQIDQMLGVVYGLLGIAVLIALMGIGNTLSLSIHERTRELGLLRAVGQSRAQVRSALRWESVIVAVFGTIGGLAIGTFLGWGLMQALSAQEGFGVFALPVTPLAVILGLAVVAGVVAALRPARRAARLDVLQAIATD
jgi:putative ABC transport system permease protein